MVAGAGCQTVELPARLALPSDAYRSQRLANVAVRPTTASHAAPGPGTQGIVVMGFDLTADGRVSNPEVLFAHPAGRFDRLAQREVWQWRLHPVPAQREDRKVRLSFRSTIVDGGERIEVTAAMPAAFDCDEESYVERGGGGRWVLMSCGEILAGRTDRQGVVGWRTIVAPRRAVLD